MDPTPSSCGASARRYHPTRDPESERGVLTAITAMPAYESLSLEELRYQQRDVGSLSLEQLQLTDAALDGVDAYRPSVARDYHDFCRLLHSVTALEAFAKLSFEELRYLDATRRVAPELAAEYKAWVETTPHDKPRVVGTWGPRVPKYAPTVLAFETETNWPFAHAITAMDAFANKSFEELRLEDRSAPVGWHRVMLSRSLSPAISLMEFRVRDAVGRVIEETPRWWERCRDRSHAENLIRPLKTNWCERLFQETMNAWYPKVNLVRFRAYMDTAVNDARTSGGVWEVVPASLEWADPFAFVFAPVTTPSLEEQKMRALDPFALVGYFCAQSRIVTSVTELQGDPDWASIRAAILEGIGEVAASLVSRLLAIAEASNLDEATSEAIAEVLHVQETRPMVLGMLRDKALRAHEYLVACEQCALDVLELRSEEVNNGHDFPSVMESVVDLVFVLDTKEPSTLSLAICDQIKRMRQALEGTNAWSCIQDGQLLHVVDPFLHAIEPGRTRQVPSLTSRQNHEDVDPYLRMSEIAFQNGIPVQFQHGGSSLPCDVVVQANGQAMFTSYIHNLHPKSCRGLYDALERVLTSMVPSFERAIWSFKRGCLLLPWFESRLPQEPAFREYLSQRPTPRASLPLLSPPQSTIWSLNGSELQVVVAMEEIHVSGSQPSVESWDPYELGLQVAAVGVYCYGSANIASASLVFHCAVNCYQGVFSYPYQLKSMAAFYGVHTEGRFLPTQTLLHAGRVSIRDGRSLVWPNSYRVRLEHVEWGDLAGNGEPGSLKLVWFYLIAPGDPVLSTADVAPHQAAWFTNFVEDVGRKFQLPEPVLELISAFSYPHYRQE